MRGNMAEVLNPSTTPGQGIDRASPIIVDGGRTARRGFPTFERLSNDSVSEDGGFKRKTGLDQEEPIVASTIFEYGKV